MAQPLVRKVSAVTSTLCPLQVLEISTLPFCHFSTTSFSISWALQNMLHQMQHKMELKFLRMHNESSSALIWESKKAHWVCCKINYPCTSTVVVSLKSFWRPMHSYSCVPLEWKSVNAEENATDLHWKVGQGVVRWCCISIPTLLPMHTECSCASFTFVIFISTVSFCCK